MSVGENIWKEDKYFVLLILAVTLITGALLLALLPPMLVPNIKPVYTSDVTIDQYGANYTSAKWKYHIEPERKYVWDPPKESWAYFDMDIRNIEDDFDLLDCKGVSFYIKGNIENQLIEFNVFTHDFTHNNKMHEVYQYWNKGQLLVTTNWRNVDISFSDLSVTPKTVKKYPGVSKSPNLRSGYAIGFAIKTYNLAENEIWIDEVELIHKNGSKTLISNFNTLNCSINQKEGLWHAGWGHL